jgi:hypothetical protein
MDRTNVETVIVAGKIRKWKGQLLDNFTGGPLFARVATAPYMTTFSMLPLT